MSSLLNRPGQERRGLERTGKRALCLLRTLSCGSFVVVVHVFGICMYPMPILSCYVKYVSNNGFSQELKTTGITDRDPTQASHPDVRLL